VDPAGRFLFIAGNSPAAVMGRVALDVAGLPISADAGGTSYVSLPSSGNCLGAALSPTGTSYTVCSQDQRIYGLAYDAGAMALASVGFATAGVSPIGVAAHPNGNFAYAASFSLSEISTFSTTADGGAPVLVGSPLSVGYSCRTLAFDASGAHLFAGCDGRILTFDVDGATGAPTLSSSVAGPTDSSYAMAIVNP
jgi:DNA-binding beta-propeller fold protein YncE